jgi:biotin carboxylase
MTRDLEGKTILLLGGNPETGRIVQVANRLGLRTVVVDPNPDAPAKLNAARSYDIDVTQIHLVSDVISREKSDGVLVGVADPLVPFYHRICEQAGLPCYANEQTVRTFCSKVEFAKACADHGVQTIPSYSIREPTGDEACQFSFPVVVKPTDSGASVGVSACYTASEFREAVLKASRHSIRKEIIVEELMQCDDIFVYYTVIDGVPYLSATADRYKTAKQGAMKTVCKGAVYPSRHQDRFLSEIHPSLVDMFKALGLENGVILIQFFVDRNGFYAYDPGFRLQGEAPHTYLKYFHGFDHREMLINFAITGQMYRGDFSLVSDPTFGGNFALTSWVLLKAGRIGGIEGLGHAASRDGVVKIIQRLDVGDVVTDAMLETERQVLCRVYIVANSKAGLYDTAAGVQSELRVFDESGADMILDYFSAEELYQ